MLYKKIFIVGLNPPPLGGISIHIKRFSELMEQKGNFVYRFDVIKESKNKSKIKYLIKLIKDLIQIKPDEIHYHTLALRKYPWEFLLLVFYKIFTKSKLILIDHICRFFYSKSFAYKKLINILMHFTDKQILIGESTYKSYLNNKIYLCKNFSVENAFLQPNIQEKEIILKKYPSDLIKFIEQHKPLVVCNASKLQIYQNKDLYGFDMAIELIDKLKNDQPKIGLVLALSSKGDEIYFNKIYSSIKNKSYIYLLLECQEEIWPLIEKCDLFIRPTVSDGASVSIDEALYLHTPVLASNSCKRQKRTILFNNRDSNDFYQKAKQILNSKYNGSNNILGLK